MTQTETLSIPKSQPHFILGVSAAVLFAFGIGPNFPFALLACIVLIVGTYMLWRPGEAQILLFIFGYQWLQLVTSIFYANIRGVPLVELLYDYPNIKEATILVAISLLCLAVGMRIGAGAQRLRYLRAAHNLIDSVSPRKWLLLHLVTWVIATAALLLALQIPGLSQPLLALANMKWGTFLILTIVTFTRPDSSRVAWLTLFGIEFVLSFGGYFSSFKLVFLYLLIAMSALGMRLTFSRVLSGIAVCAVLLTLGLYWTAIKNDYRWFVSGGEKAQAVVVDRVEAIQKIVEFTSEVNSDQLANAADSLARRFAEIDMFSAVLDKVPRVIPHEWGKLWLDAISRPFMPRILFPSKAVIDESALTTYYTGMAMAGMAEGTQISMGYIAESYIDFSEVGMMGAILLFGYFMGRIYKWCVHHPNAHGIFGFGLASVTLMQASSIGFSSAKLFGGIVVTVLIDALLLSFIIPRCMSWLKN